jgi:hypothetical protein
MIVGSARDACRPCLAACVVDIDAVVEGTSRRRARAHRRRYILGKNSRVGPLPTICGVGQTPALDDSELVSRRRLRASTR